MEFRFARAVLVATGILLIAAVDYSSGVEIRTYPLYYMPISYAAWHFGRPGAVIAACCATIGWFVSNQLAGLQFSHSAIWAANALVQGASFLTVGLLVANLAASALRERAMSRRDALCDLFNSRAFHEDGARLLALCQRGRHAITLAYLDLDDFKLVNDTQGHPAGDALLQRIARTLQSSIRSGDLVARLGGDEFAILMPETGPEEARQMLERLRAALTTTAADSSVPTVTLSIGAVTFVPAPDDLQTLVQQADAIMYSVKKSGKGRFHLEVVASEEAQRGAPAPADTRIPLTRRTG